MNKEESEEESKEEKTEEEKEVDTTEKTDLHSIFSDIKNIMVSQQKEIEELKKQIEDFKKPEKEPESLKPGDLNDFKNDIKEMLQGYNRNNPSTERNETFEKSQMDILNRRF